MSFEVRDAVDSDLPAITAIYNAAIRDTLAVWTDRPVTLEARAAWVADRRAAGFPVLVAAGPGEGVLGFASYGAFRSGDGYAATVEHSVHVAAHARRRGVGRALIERLLQRARGQGLHAMVGGVEAGNEASLALHRDLGFTPAGRLPQVGRKRDRWLDLVFVVCLLDLEPPEAPES